MTLTEIIPDAFALIEAGARRQPVFFEVDRGTEAVRAFSSFEAEPGLKFDKIYSVYSQRFQQSDFEEGDRWDPSVMPKLCSPTRSRATPLSTSRRSSG